MKFLCFLVSISSLVACGDALKKSGGVDPNLNNSANNSTNNATNNTNNSTVVLNNQTNNLTNNTPNNSTNNATNNTPNNSTNNATNNATNGEVHTLHVQLVWDTPGDTDQTDGNGTDLDVHVAHPDGSIEVGRTDPDLDGVAEPWGSPKFDCFWRNPNPEWGAIGDELDDPSQDIDDTNGQGPENINLEEMEPIVYRVGAAYFQDNGYGPSEATVRIYVDGVLVHEASHNFPLDGTLWEVAWVDGATGEVVSRDTPNGPLLFSPIP